MELFDFTPFDLNKPGIVIVIIQYTHSYFLFIACAVKIKN